MNVNDALQVPPRTCPRCGELVPAYERRRYRERIWCSDKCRRKAGKKAAREREVLSKVERLRIAGQVAPAVRKVNMRKAIKVVGTNGEVKRVLSEAEMLGALAERAGIELASTNGKAPKGGPCSDCGKIIAYAKGSRSGRCDACKYPVCIDCGAFVSGAHRPRLEREKPRRCKPCAMKAAWSNQSYQDARAAGLEAVGRKRRPKNCTSCGGRLGEKNKSGLCALCWGCHGQS